jgi:transcriptional regulator with XRE-family HTH domain
MALRMEPPKIDGTLCLLIGRNVENTRKSWGWSQGKLAAFSDMERGTVASVEEGSDGTQFRTLLKIAAVFGVDVRRLMATDYSVDEATPSYLRQSDTGRQPPDLRLVAPAPLSPAASGALSSARPAKGLGLRTVAAQPIAVAQVTPKVTSSARRAPAASSAKPRQR